MINKLYKNLINSINGLKIVISEHSFIIELILGAIIVPYVFIAEITFEIKIIIIVIYLMLLAFEIINTSIEKLCNKITKNYDEDKKIIKDLASASVFIVLLILIFLILFTIFY